jgi:hypothetical protein
MMLDRVEQLIARHVERATAPGASTTDDDREFDRLALDVFAYQYERIPLYRRLCELRDVAPGQVTHWSLIPAVPADLFKEEGLAAHAGDAAAVFVSSGTTQGSERRSRHALGARELELYRRASMEHFRAMVLPDGPGPMNVVLLGPRRTTHPSSSLGHMYEFVLERFGADAGADTGANTSANTGEGPVLFDAGGRLDVDAAVARLEAAAGGTSPVLILALRSTLTAVFETMRSRRLALRLPADSRLVHTGGSKGGRTMSRAGILKAAWRFLHIPAYLSLEEYGMTELLSQFYDDAFVSRWSGRLADRSKLGPAWTRTWVVDPATLSRVPRGEQGLIRHLDLANCAGVSAVQTLDLGVETGRGFEILGRAPGADDRGCSVLMATGPSLPEPGEPEPPVAGI